MRSDRWVGRLTAGLAALIALGASAGPASASPNVVVTIKPIHSLVAGVMGDAGEPVLLVGGGQSPHTFRLSPSDASALQAADLIVQVGAGLEQFLARPLAAIARRAEVLTLAEADGMTLLPFRAAAIWPGHDDDGREADHGGGIDPHLWLDPDNAEAAVAAVAAALAGLDPDRADVYQANAAALAAKLEQLDAELATALAPVRDKPFLVFHDGYQYLARHFDLAAVGAIAISPERRPSAAHLKALQAAIKARDVRCVFAEPQFEPRLIAAVLEDIPTRIAMLDPLGVDLPAGPEHYAAMMRRNVEALRACLAVASPDSG